MKNQYEIIIIGCGPGGLAAAEELAKNGKNVLLLEKNKEIGPKVCGGGLTTKISDLNIPLELFDKKFKQEKIINKLKISKIIFNTAFNIILLLSHYKKPAKKFHDFFLG